VGEEKFPCPPHIIFLKKDLDKSKLMSILKYSDLNGGVYGSIKNSKNGQLSPA